jgi:hypothetical protein
MSESKWLRRAALGAVLVLGACGGGAASGGGGKAPDAESGEAAAEGGQGSGETAAEAAAPAPPTAARAQEQRAMSLEVTVKLLLEGRDAGIAGKGWSFEEGRKYSIEKVSGNAVTELSVVYGKREGKGLEGWSPMPTENKGYRVLLGKGGDIEVRDADDKAAGSAESEVAKSEYGYLGKPHPLLVQVVAAKPSAGQKLALDAAAAVALIGYMPEMSIVELSGEYQGTEQQDGREAAKVQVTFQSKLREGTLVYTLDLSGPALVDTSTGWVIKLDLSGKVTVSGKYTAKGKTFDAAGGGKATLTRTTIIK